MRAGGDFVDAPKFDYDAWKDALRPHWGWYSPQAIEHKAFAGIARLRSVCGFVGMDITCNAPRIERTQRDIRVDEVDHFYAVFQIVGRSKVIQHDRAVHLGVGDVALVDSARPVTYLVDDAYGQVFSLQLPRRSLVSHLGFEPQFCSYGCGACSAGRLLFQLVSNVVEDADTQLGPMSGYMPLAVYDLVGALFLPSRLPPGSAYTDKLFTRIRGIIREGLTDPDLGPREVAAKAGISLRYLQKLFTERGTTCSEFIYSFRLDFAACLLRRRLSLGSRQPLSDVAYASGFRDYSHFARKFRHRFGHAPGKCPAASGRATDVAFGSRIDESAAI